jgi:hypothetical protein
LYEGDDPPVDDVVDEERSLDFEEDVALAMRWSIKEKFRRGKRNKFI